MKNDIKISIITVCYNSEKTIEDTVKSVLNQNYNNYEYLIIDGSSKDNTLSIVKKYEKDFKGKLRVISENDKGLYDAMNKGIELATGDVIGIINSDDLLIDSNVFSKINESYNEDTDILYANLYYVSEDLKDILRKYNSGRRKGYSWCPAHPTMYIRKEVFKKYGLYDIGYKIAADYDMMVRLNKENLNYTYLDDYIVLMRVGGVSNGIKGYFKNYIEAYKVLKHNNVSFPLFRTTMRGFYTVWDILKK